MNSLRSYQLLQRHFERWKNDVSLKHKHFKLQGNIRRPGLKNYLKNKKDIRSRYKRLFQSDNTPVLFMRGDKVYMSPSNKRSAMLLEEGRNQLDDNEDGSKKFMSENNDRSLTNSDISRTRRLNGQNKSMTSGKGIQIAT